MVMVMVMVIVIVIVIVSSSSCCCGGGSMRIVSKDLMHLKVQDTTRLMAYHVIASLQMYASCSTLARNQCQQELDLQHFKQYKQLWLFR